MIVIAARIQVSEGREQDFINEYKKAVVKVLNDPGAIEYTLHQDAGDATRFFFYEKYQDQKAVEYHRTTPHFKEFFQKTGAYTVGKPEITQLKIVE